MHSGLAVFLCAQYPQLDSNQRTRLRRPALYPLSYGGSYPLVYHNLALRANRITPLCGNARRVFCTRHKNEYNLLSS